MRESALATELPFHSGHVGSCFSFPENVLLEPWLNMDRNPWSSFSEEDVRRWERRFLDWPWRR